MKTTDLIELWIEDSKLDKTKIDHELIRIPELHSKYYNIFMQERIMMHKYQAEYKQLYKLKFEYYNGTISQEDLEDKGWQPFALKILKTDIPMYMDADPDLQSIQDKIVIQKEKVDFVDSIIKSLTNRGFQLKSAVDFMKFQHGVN